ncbi:MAG: hypothetical protein QM690_11330 [Sphingobium sp.]
MSEEHVSLDAARERAATARIELRAALDDALGWFSPSRIKAEMAEAASHQIDEVKTALRRSVTRHPLIAWPALALVAGGITYLLRRPAAAAARSGAQAVRALYRRFSARN